MKKRLISLLLTLCLLFSLLPVGAAAEENTYQGMFTYTVANGEVTVTGYVIGYNESNCPVYACTDIVIPSYIDGYPVTTIGRAAFHPISGLRNELRSITLPDTLTTIKNEAFKGCSGLTEITIPSSVTSMGSFAFSECSGLKKITLGALSNTPASTTLSFWNVFTGCSPETLVLGSNITEAPVPAYFRDQLKEVYVSSSVILIDDSEPYILPFGNATIYGYTGSAAERYATKHGNTFVPLDGGTSSQPKTVDLISTIPAKGDTKVTSNQLSLTFSRNISANPSWNLGSLYIKDYNTNETVLEIDDKVFYSLGGSISGDTLTIPNAFKNLSPGKYYVLMDSGVITADRVDSDNVLRGFAGITRKDALSFTKVASASDPAISRDITIATGLEPSEGNVTATVTVQWDDGWFDTPATTYNHQLAVSSMALSGAAYVNVSKTNIQNALSDLGFDALYSNYTPPTQLDNDIVSYSFGTKTLCGSDGNLFTLVAVVVKGTSSNEEWYSNFNIGTGATHQGFQLASSKLLTNLRSYLRDNNVDNARFLVTGHSRGAGVANLTAADLTREYGQDRVYGYTFAAPTVSQNATESGYQNIFNIINGEDFVPRVPLKRWGFARYGIDLQLPSRSYYGSSYDAIFNTMERTYRSLTGTSYPAYSSGTKSVDNLVADVYQLANSADQYYSVKRTISAPTQGSMSTYFQGLSDYLITKSTGDLAWFASTLNGDFRPITLFFAANQNGVLSTKVLGAHGMASYYSWLATHSAETLFGSSNRSSCATFKRLEVACPVDVFVYDQAGTLVASIVNDEVVVNTLAASVDGEVKTIDLPDDQDYRVEVIATGTGTVDYSVEELSLQGGETTVRNTTSFEDIPIVPGDKLVGQVDSNTSNSSGDYTPEKNGEPLDEPQSPSSTPFTDVRPDQYYYTPVLWAVKNGITSGTTPTTFSPKDTCTREQVVTFLWRAMGCPEPASSVNPFTDVKETSYAYKAILWAYETGITTGATDTTFNPKGACTRGQVVTFLWRTEGEPFPNNPANPFYDVTARQYYFTAVRWAAENNITTGTTSTTFSPNDSCTRAQIVTFLYRDLAE